MRSLYGDIAILIVGAGSIGRRHAINLRSLGIRHIAICDTQAERAAAVARDVDGRISSTVIEALETGPDCVVVACPPESHLEIGRLVAEAGAHLFIEKPLGVSLAGWPEVESQLKTRGRRSSVACNMRFHPGPAAIKSLVDSGAIGNVLSARLHVGSYLPTWRPSSDYRTSYSASRNGGGAILECIHEIDLALWYFGVGDLLYATSLPASPLGLEADGLAELIVRHEGGAISSIHLNFVQRDYHRTCLVIGTDGTIVWDFLQGTVTVHGLSGEVSNAIVQPDTWSVNDMYLAQFKALLYALATGVPPANPIRQALQTLDIALRAREA